MPEIQVAELVRKDLLGGFRCGFVGEMSMATQDPLFETPWAAKVVLQHLDIVVCLQQENMSLTRALNNKFCGVTQVREETDVAIPRPDEKPNRILSVVRDTECVHQDIPDLKTGACFEHTASHRVPTVRLQNLTRQPVAIHGCPQFLGQQTHPLGVVAMFVSDENG
jgi:hypothetical protein